MKHPVKRSSARDHAPRNTPLLLALEELGGGAVVVLDRDLRIAEVTPAAAELLGSPPRGVLAARVFCGSTAQRPIAEALVAGRSADATIPSPRGSGRVRVHARPLHEGRKVAGFVMLFEPEAEEDDAVCVAGMW